MSGWVNPIHGGGAPELTASVFYTGTDTLYEGWALCYDFNAADVNQENETLTGPESTFNAARRILVEKPSELNKIHFAGVVAAESDGMTGPGWVKIHRPGSVCNVYAYSDSDHEKGTSVASGQLLNVTVGQYYLMTGGLPGTGSAMVLQDVDRSSTAGLVMAELLTGAPSGGYSKVSCSAASYTLSQLSALLSADVMYAGQYDFTFADNISASISAAIIAAEGKWIGQRVVIKCTSTASTSNCIVSNAPVTFSTGQVIETTNTLGALSLIVATGFSGHIAKASDGTGNFYCDFEWTGARWVLRSTNSVTVISVG